MKRKKFKNIKGKLIGDQIYYSTKDVLNMFDLKAERLRKWIDMYFGFPFCKAEGTGKTHYFRRDHLYLIGFYKQLVDSGLNRDQSSFLVEEVSPEKWEQIRNQKKDCFIYITPDPTKEYNKEGRIRDKKMLLQFIPGTNFNLPKLHYLDLNPIWVTNLYDIVKYVDSNLIE